MIVDPKKEFAAHIHINDSKCPQSKSSVVMCETLKLQTNNQSKPQVRIVDNNNNNNKNKIKNSNTLKRPSQLGKRERKRKREEHRI